MAAWVWHLHCMRLSSFMRSVNSLWCCALHNFVVEINLNSLSPGKSNLFWLLTNVKAKTSTVTQRLGIHYVVYPHMVPDCSHQHTFLKTILFLLCLLVFGLHCKRWRSSHRHKTIEVFFLFVFSALKLKIRNCLIKKSVFFASNLNRRNLRLVGPCHVSKKRLGSK